MVEDVSLLPVDKNSLFMDESALVKDKFAPPSFTYVPAVKSTNLKVKTATKMSHRARRYEYEKAKLRDTFLTFVKNIIFSQTEAY